MAARVAVPSIGAYSDKYRQLEAARQRQVTEIAKARMLAEQVVRERQVHEETKRRKKLFEERERRRVEEEERLRQNTLEQRRREREMQTLVFKRAIESERVERRKSRQSSALSRHSQRSVVSNKSQSGSYAARAQAKMHSQKAPASDRPPALPRYSPAAGAHATPGGMTAQRKNGPGVSSNARPTYVAGNNYDNYAAEEESDFSDGETDSLEVDDDRSEEPREFRIARAREVELEESPEPSPQPQPLPVRPIRPTKRPQEEHSEDDDEPYDSLDDASDADERHLRHSPPATAVTAATAAAAAAVGVAVGVHGERQKALPMSSFGVDSAHAGENRVGTAIHPPRADVTDDAPESPPAVRPSRIPVAVAKSAPTVVTDGSAALGAATADSDNAKSEDDGWELESVRPLPVPRYPPAVAMDIVLSNTFGGKRLFGVGSGARGGGEDSRPEFATNGYGTANYGSYALPYIPPTPTVNTVSVDPRGQGRPPLAPGADGPRAHSRFPSISRAPPQQSPIPYAPSAAHKMRENALLAKCRQLQQGRRRMFSDEPDVDDGHMDLSGVSEEERRVMESLAKLDLRLLRR